MRRALLVTVAIALAAPCTAGAHLRTSRGRRRLPRLRAPLDPLRVRVYPSAAGAAAAILGLVVFFDVLEHYEEPELSTAAERSSAGR